MVEADWLATPAEEYWFYWICSLNNYEERSKENPNILIMSLIVSMIFLWMNEMKYLIHTTIQYHQYILQIYTMSSYGDINIVSDKFSHSSDSTTSHPIYSVVSKGSKASLCLNFPMENLKAAFTQKTVQQFSHHRYYHSICI